MEFGKKDYGLAGLMIGWIAMMGFVTYTGPNVNTARVFEEENRPNVMRLYLSGKSDQIMVEGETGEYVDLSEYLKSIEDTADRLMERAGIEKRVDWYSE